MGSTPRDCNPNNNRHILSASGIRRGQEAAAKLPTECITVIASQGKMPRPCLTPRRPPGTASHPTCSIGPQTGPCCGQAMMAQFSLCSVTEICSLPDGGWQRSMRCRLEGEPEQGSGHQAWSVKSGDTSWEGGTSWAESLYPQRMFHHPVWLISQKHRFKHKIWAFGILLSRGLCVVGLPLVAHLQSCPWLIAVHVVAWAWVWGEAA